jgi:hypothetical protein
LLSAALATKKRKKPERSNNVIDLAVSLGGDSRGQGKTGSSKGVKPSGSIIGGSSMNKPRNN